MIQQMEKRCICRWYGWWHKRQWNKRWGMKCLLRDCPKPYRNPIPWRLPMLKKTYRTEFTMRPATRSAELVGMPKYASTVAVKSLIVTEGEEEREIMWRKKGITIVVLRYGLVLMPGGTIVRIVSSHPTAVSWYYLKNAEITALVLAIYADRVLVVVVFIAVVVEVSLKKTAVGAM